MRGKLSVIILLLAILSVNSQNKEIGTVEVLGAAFDIRNTDPLNWTLPTLISGERKILVNPTANSVYKPISIIPERKVHFIESAYDYEQSVLGTDSIKSLYLSDKSRLFSQRFLNGEDKPLLVYTQYKVPLKSQKLRTLNVKNLDSTFVDWVERLGEDVTLAGFIHNFGTHFATEVTSGGNFITRLNIPRDEYIFSFYSEKKFKQKLIAHFTEANYPEENLPFGKNLFVYTVGGSDLKGISQWHQTLRTEPVAIDATLERITVLLTENNFPHLKDIQKKRDTLDWFIDEVEENIKTQIKQKANGDYFRKYAIEFRHRVDNILKTQSGSDQNKENAFTGDLFFGGFTDDQTLINSQPVINIGGIRIETLITDEIIEINKSLKLIVPPEHLETGFVNVWDEAAKLIKGKGRSQLVITGESENRIYFKDAFNYKITKEIDIETIDGDIYSITHSLEALKPSEELLLKNQNRKHVMDSELVASASVGDISKIKEFLLKGANKQATGMVRTAIINRHPVSFFNALFDEGVKPSTADLDLLFDEDYFDPQIALIFLERGAVPKNNMIFKAVAYRQPSVVKALRRMGAKAVNNDLDFAIKLKDTALIHALTGKKNQISENGQIIYTENSIQKVEEGKARMDIAKNEDKPNSFPLTVNEIKNGNFPADEEIIIEDILISKTNSTIEIPSTNDSTIHLKNMSFNSEESIKIEQKTITGGSKSQSEIEANNEYTIVYKVKKGDVLVNIAKKYNVSVPQLKKWNYLNSSRIDIDQELLIYLDEGN